MGPLVLTPADIPHLLAGLAILGTGGGGNPGWGRLILENDHRRGRAWNVITLDEVPDDATVVCAGMMGSVKAIESIGFANLLERWETDFPLLTVVKAMEGLLGRRIDALVPFEAGGLNSPVVLTLGARLGIPVIDGDALGRSAPETQMTSWHGHGVEITPMPLADSVGDIVIVTRAAEPASVDEIGRVVLARGGHLGANAHHPMTGARLKATTIPGTFSRALELGRAVAGSADPVRAVAATLGAAHLFSGLVTSLAEEERQGFYFTTVRLDGSGLDAGRTARLIIKNETMALFRDERPIAIFPDAVLLVEPGTGRGIMSIELQAGMPIELLGAPAHPRLREAATATPQGRAAFSPERYGQPDLVYQPIEELRG
jgi:DUF917 family protein